MFGDAAARLVGRAHDGVANVVADVDDGAGFFHLLRIEPFGVDSVEAVGFDPADGFAHIPQRVGQVENSALREEQGAVELFFQPLPQFQRVFVDRCGFIPQVVRPDDGGVAGHVAACQPSFFHDGDVRDAMVFGQIVGGGQTVPTTSYDDDVIGLFGLRISPHEVGVFRQFPLIRSQNTGVDALNAHGRLLAIGSDEQESLNDN